MKKFGVSQSVARKEDARFLVGAGKYVDDSAPDGALFVHFLLSPVAHGKIVSIDVEDARSAEGVHGVFTAANLIDSGLRNRIEASVLQLPSGTLAAAPVRPVLALDKVNFVGEPIALVAADTLNQARDAAELIELDIEEIDPHMEVSPGGTDIHAEAPDNLAFDWFRGDEAEVGRIFAKAQRVVSMHVNDHRIIANSLEPRGCQAEWKDGRLHFAINGQGVWPAKRDLSDVLGIDEADVQVTTSDVGGGFGMKGFTYPENFAVAQSARILGRPLRWMSTRSEAMLTDNSGRDLHSAVEGAFDGDGRFLAYRVVTHCNLGAYNSYFGQFIQTELSEKVLTGTYHIPSVFFRVRGIYTNTTQVDAYRGAGRPEAIYMIERLMDRAAREFGISQSEMRRRNFIPPDRFPYRNFGPETFDVGEFDRVLTRAEIEADFDGFDRRRTESARSGKLRGLGLCYYIEAILGDPDETTKIEFADDGMVNVYVGTQSNGQGHETVFAQILHERTGIPFEQVRLIQGDSDLIAKGGGTGGSRSVTTQGVSINGTSDRMIEKFIPFVAEQLEERADDVSFDDGTFKVAGTNKFLGIMDAAKAARSNGRRDLLTTQFTTELSGKSYPNGAHVCEVEIDPETGHLTVEKYTVVDDLGFLMNPMLAAGQVHGGVAQGVGQVVMEHAEFDDSGQLLSGSFMDYAMPRASDIPFIEFHSEPTPSVNNPIGMKGCGEAGTIGAMAAAANAVQDALWARGVREINMPITSEKVWCELKEAASG